MNALRRPKEIKKHTRISKILYFFRKIFFSLPFLVCLLLVLLFFHKTFFKGYVPLPFDLLISEYSPFKFESYLGYDPGAYPSKAQYFDVLRQFYPWKTFAIDSIKEGIFPLWNPYNFSGAPLFANHQSSLLYPSSLLFLFLPMDVAWTIFILSQTPLLFLFTYMYARKIGLKVLGAILASVAFSCSLFISSYFEYGIFGHTILLLPLLLYLIEELLEKKRRKKALLIPCCIMLVFFAGHLQIASYVIAFVVLYFFIRAGMLRRFSVIPQFLLLFFIGLLLSAIQLLPVLELFSYSARTNHNLEYFQTNLLFQLKNLILFFSPDFFGNPSVRNYLLTSSYPSNSVYIGIGAILFTLFSILWVRKKMVILYAGLFVLIFILVSNNFISNIVYQIPIPQIRASTPTNAQFLLLFCMTVLSGFGFDAFFEKWNAKKIIIPWSLVVFFLSFYAILLQFNFIEGYKRALIFSFIVLGALTGLLFLVRMLPLKKIYIQYIFLFVVVLDLFYFFQKFNPFSPPQITFSKPEVISQLLDIQGIDRSWGYSLANIEPNFQTYFSSYSPDGYDPLYPVWYGEFIQLSKEGRIPENFTTQTRSDAGVAQGFGAMDFKENKYRKGILDALGVRYILDRVDNGLDQNAFDTGTYSLLYDKGGWKIYENKTAYPRMYFADGVAFYEDREEFAKKFIETTLQERRTVFLEKGSIENKNFSTGRATLLKYNPSSVLILTNSDGEGLLFLSDTYFPGWKVTIDGKQSKIVRANYAFRGVVVPEGKHTVVFKYEPLSFRIGIYAFLAGLGIVMCYGIYWVRSIKK